jgi:hypothetical protein
MTMEATNEAIALTERRILGAWSGGRSGTRAAAGSIASQMTHETSQSSTGNSIARPRPRRSFRSRSVTSVTSGMASGSAAPPRTLTPRRPSGSTFSCEAQRRASRPKRRSCGQTVTRTDWNQLGFDSCNVWLDSGLKPREESRDWRARARESLRQADPQPRGSRGDTARGPEESDVCRPGGDSERAHLSRDEWREPRKLGRALREERWVHPADSPPTRRRRRGSRLLPGA